MNLLLFLLLPIGHAFDLPPVATPSADTPLTATLSHEDGRCRCVCPNPAVVNATHSEQKVYIQSVLPSECKCDQIVLHRLSFSSTDEMSLDERRTRLKEQFCPRCICRYETRNTTWIKIVVIVVVFVITMLSIYMMFLMCLDPWIRRNKSSYQEHTNEEISLQPLSSSFQESVVRMETLHGASGSVLHRVGHQQSKWQKTVQEQRRHIYDTHTMLN